MKLNLPFRDTMEFSWKAFFLAPALVPFLFSLDLAIISTAGKSPMMGFLLIFLIGCFFSYSITWFLFLPCLYLVSKVITLNMLRISLLGAVLSTLAAIPVIWQDYQASGDNSGPPSGTFSEFLLRQLSDPLWWILFPLGGLVTATVYWLLATAQAPHKLE